MSKKHTRLDGRRIGVAEKYPHALRCPACLKEKLCNKCGADAMTVNCLCTMTEAEGGDVYSLTPHQVATLVSVSDPPITLASRGVREVRDETIAYEKGAGWWAGYTPLDGRTAYVLMRRGMITTDHAISGDGVEYYKLTRLGRLVVVADYEYRKELGAL